MNLVSTAFSIVLSLHHFVFSSSCSSPPPSLPTLESICQENDICKFRSHFSAIRDKSILQPAAFVGLGKAVSCGSGEMFGYFHEQINSYMQEAILGAMESLVRDNSLDTILSFFPAIEGLKAIQQPAALKGLEVALKFAKFESFKYFSGKLDYSSNLEAIQNIILNNWEAFLVSTLPSDVEAFFSAIEGFDISKLISHPVAFKSLEVTAIDYRCSSFGVFL